MLEYALKLTRSPDAMERFDVEALRAHGFDDRAIHDICAVTAYFAFANRVADGLGLEFEPFHREMEPCCANQKPSLNPEPGKRIAFRGSAKRTPQPSETVAQISSRIVT